MRVAGSGSGSCCARWEGRARWSTSFRRRATTPGRPVGRARRGRWPVAYAGQGRRHGHRGRHGPAPGRGLPRDLSPVHDGEPNRPLVFRAYRGESPIISGADPLTAWRQSEDGQWLGKMDWDLKDGNQLLPGMTRWSRRGGRTARRCSSPSGPRWPRVPRRRLGSQPAGGRLDRRAAVARFRRGVDLSEHAGRDPRPDYLHADL